MTSLKNHIIALLFLVSAANAQTTTSEKIDAYLTRLTGFGLTGAVLVAQDGKVILEKGYGLADRRRNLPFTKDTVIDIGSNTKDLTRVAILQLAQNRKLHLNDRLPKFFDNVPADKAGITVEQLLDHRAGIGQYSGRDQERLTKEEFLKRVFGAPLIAAPGTEENYSNPGYSLLAAIIEKASGQSYDQYVQDQILKPAGMTTTGYILPNWRDGQLARNYQHGEEQPSTFDYPHLPDGPSWNLRGNGGTLSTVGDMYRFHLALLGDKLLAKEFKARLFDPNGPLMLVGGNGVHYFVHQVEPADRLVIMVSTTDARLRATEVSALIAALARGRDLALPPQLLKLEAAKLAKFAGKHLLPSGAELEVAAKDDHLFVSGANEAGFRLLQGNHPRANPEAMEKMTAQVKAMLEAAAKGDHRLSHKAFEAAMPYEQFKLREDEIWQRRRNQLGDFKSLTMLGTAPAQGNYVTTARIDCERGADYIQYIWGGGMLRGIRLSRNTPGVHFYPQTGTEFINYDITSGTAINLVFTPQGNGYSVNFAVPPNRKN